MPHGTSGCSSTLLQMRTPSSGVKGKRPPPLPPSPHPPPLAAASSRRRRRPAAAAASPDRSPRRRTRGPSEGVPPQTTRIPTPTCVLRGRTQPKQRDQSPGNTNTKSKQQSETATRLVTRYGKRRSGISDGGAKMGEEGIRANGEEGLQVPNIGFMDSGILAWLVRGGGMYLGYFCNRRQTWKLIVCIIFWLQCHSRGEAYFGSKGGEDRSLFLG